MRVPQSAHLYREAVRNLHNYGHLICHEIFLLEVLRRSLYSAGRGRASTVKGPGSWPFNSGFLT